MALWTNFMTGPDPGILDWFTILMGVTSASILTFHGANYLAMKTDGQLRGQARRAAWLTGSAVAVLIELVATAVFIVQPSFHLNYAVHPIGYVFPFIDLAALVAALSLKMKGFDVASFGKESRPSRNLDLLEELGVRYISTNDLSIREAAKRFGPFDLMFEATGYSPVAFEAMECLGKNGVLVLASVTGGDREHSVPADKINLDFVLGNKLVVGTVNANREYFEAGVYDFARAELEFPGWLQKLLTHPVTGLENYQVMMSTLTTERNAIKVYVNVGYE